MENITKCINETFFVDDEQDDLSEKEYLFKVAVRGVLNYIVQLIATFLNVSTIVVIWKYRGLHITSNALLVCFSIGNSLAFINGTLAILTDFILNVNTKSWKIVCTGLNFFLLLQQYVNIISITAISIERVYCIFFPLHSFQHNNFTKMTKVSIFILIFAFLIVSTEITLGFFLGNFIHVEKILHCGYGTVVGTTVLLYIVIPIVLIFSKISLFFTGLVAGKLIYLKRRRPESCAPKNMRSEYKVTQMLLTGMFTTNLESQLGGFFHLFAPNFGEVAGTYKWYFVSPWIIFCQSLTAVSVVSTQKGGGDTHNLTATIESI